MVVPSMTWRVHTGDCREHMAAMPEASIDAIVCDPPYGLEFMGKAWDAPWRTGDDFRRSRNEADAGRDNVFGRASKRGPEYRAGVGFQAWTEQWAIEALRVLKPGGHLLAFGGTRTYHRMACAIEDAGFEVRDCLAWLYGSGFPKSLDVSKAIDKAARGDLARCRIAAVMDYRGFKLDFHAFDKALGLAATGGGGSRDWIFGGHVPSDATWQRIRSSLDLTPEDEATVEREAVRRVHRKNGRDATSIRLGFQADEYDVTAPATPDAEAWQGWGTALKPAFEPIILARKPLVGTVAANVLAHGTGALNIDATRIAGDMSGANYGGRQEARHGNGETTGDGWQTDYRTQAHADGRWPANVLLDGEAAAILNAQAGPRQPGASPAKKSLGSARVYGDAERAGVEKQREQLDGGGPSRYFYCAKASRRERNAGLDDARNAHPTVKPVDVMRWLCRLIAPPGGVILDPFTGSGTTGIAATLEGFSFVGCEQDADYTAIAEARIALFAVHGEEALEAVRVLERADAESEAHRAMGQLDLLGGSV